MYSAASGLGAGGLQDISLVDTSNSVLYALFAVTGLVSGGIANGARSLKCFPIIPNTRLTRCQQVLGPRLTLFIGTLGYALYVGSLWWYACLFGN